MSDARKYYIPRHVHFASEGESVVFMDLRHDKYSMLLGAKAQAFMTMLSQQRHTTSTLISLDSSERLEDRGLCQGVLTELLENNLLTGDSESTCPRRPAIQLPQTTLAETTDYTNATISGLAVWRFINASIGARLLIRYMSIETIIRRIERRKTQQAVNGPVDLSELKILVGTFNRLRPLIPWNYLCLFDSLALLEFLARYKLFPTWVFAVRLEPWGAHCWLQHDLLALNEDSDEVRTYLPIMAV